MAAQNIPENNLCEKTNHWIDQNRTAIGQKILCAGLPDGAVDHLTHLFPGAAIVCLKKEKTPADSPESAGRSPSVLTIASDLDSYEGGLFDTVICADSAPLCPETPAEDFPQWEQGTFYLRRATLLMEYYEAKAHAMRRHLRPGGTLLALVRADHDEYLLGFCFALAAEEMQLDPASLRQILCRENGGRVTLQGIAAQAGARSDIGSLVAENLNFSLDRMNTAAEQMQGREAEIFIQADAADLRRGYHLYRDGQLMGKLALYNSVQRPDVIYYFTDVVGDGPYLRRFHEQDAQKVLRHLVGELHRQKATDKSITWKELEMQDSWQEIEK